jgi:hypothetical protein
VKRTNNTLAEILTAAASAALVWLRRPTAGGHAARRYPARHRQTNPDQPHPAPADV